ncbi:MAG: hypothetical protein AAGG02_12000 [Cyanobacteria bacterium P01_H01_bin.15]
MNLGTTSFQNDPVRLFLLVNLAGFSLSSVAVNALPSPEDRPEEILRTEIIVEARSPIDGREMTPGEYARLQEDVLAQSKFPPQMSDDIRQLVFLANIRKFLKTITPF